MNSDKPYGKRERLLRRAAATRRDAFSGLQQARAKAEAVLRDYATQRPAGGSGGRHRRPTLRERFAGKLFDLAVRTVVWKIERDTTRVMLARLEPMGLDKWLGILKAGPKMNWSATA